MATINADDLTAIRRAMEDYARANGIPVTWVKGAVNAAAQAVEDFLVANQVTVSSAIDTATLPFGVTFTAAQKKQIGAYVFLAKYGRDKS